MKPRMLLASGAFLLSGTGKGLRRNPGRSYCFEISNCESLPLLFLILWREKKCYGKTLPQGLSKVQQLPLRKSLTEAVEDDVVVADNAEYLVVFDDRRKGQAEAVEEAGAVTNVHVRPD